MRTDNANPLLALILFRRRGMPACRRATGREESIVQFVGGGGATTGEDYPVRVTSVGDGGGRDLDARGAGEQARTGYVPGRDGSEVQKENPGASGEIRDHWAPGAEYLVSVPTLLGGGSDGMPVHPAGMAADLPDGHPLRQIRNSGILKRRGNFLFKIPHSSHFFSSSQCRIQMGNQCGRGGNQVASSQRHNPSPEVVRWLRSARDEVVRVSTVAAGNINGARPPQIRSL